MNKEEFGLLTTVRHSCGYNSALFYCVCLICVWVWVSQCVYGGQRTTLYSQVNSGHQALSTEPFHWLLPSCWHLTLCVTFWLSLLEHSWYAYSFIMNNLFNCSVPSCGGLCNQQSDLLRVNGSYCSRALEVKPILLYKNVCTWCRKARFFTCVTIPPLFLIHVQCVDCSTVDPWYVWF